MTAMPGRTPIVIERTYDHPREQVFAAWSDAEGLQSWMCPGDITRATVEVDFRVGGTFHIVMHAPDGDYSHRGEYLEIDPPRRLVMTWVSEFLPAAESRTRVTITFESLAGGRTRLLLVHDELPFSSAYDGHPHGWTTILGLLDEHLSRSRVS